MFRRTPVRAALTTPNVDPACLRHHVMRPLYAFLLAGPHYPRAVGFCSPPSSFVPQPLVQVPQSQQQLASTGHTSSSRRASQRAGSSTPTAASCGRNRHDATRQLASPLENIDAPRRRRPLRWVGRSASTRVLQQHSAVGSQQARTSTSSSSSSEARSKTRASVMPADTKIASGLIASRAGGADVGGSAADPTAAAHAYLSEFLGMTEEVSDCYRHGELCC